MLYEPTRKKTAGTCKQHKRRCKCNGLGKDNSSSVLTCWWVAITGKDNVVRCLWQWSLVNGNLWSNRARGKWILQKIRKYMFEHSKLPPLPMGCNADLVRSVTELTDRITFFEWLTWKINYAEYADANLENLKNAQNVIWLLQRYASAAIQLSILRLRFIGNCYEL